MRDLDCVAHPQVAAVYKQLDVEAVRRELSALARETGPLPESSLLDLDPEFAASTRPGSVRGTKVILLSYPRKQKKRREEVWN